MPPSFSENDTPPTHEFFSKHKASNPPFSHTSFMGGRYFVKGDKETENEMFSAIEKTLKLNKPHFMNEIATDVFNFFIDLDFYLKDLLEDAPLQQFVSILFSTVSRFFPTSITDTDSNFFETILLHASPPPLLSSTMHLREFVSRFKTGDTLFIEGGRVKKGEVVHEVEWIAAVEDACVVTDGRYTCCLSADMLTVSLSPGDRVFLNTFGVVDEDANCCLRSGAPPPGAVSVASAAAKGATWSYSSKTVFLLEDGVWFMNSARDEQGYLKQGMHVIFPKCQVGIEEALFMREALLNELITHFGNTFGKEGWENILDANVYKTGSGLRMYGAHKTKTCPACSGKKKREREDDCGIHGCKNGKIDTGRPHLLHSVYVDGARVVHLEAIYKKNLNLLLRKTSIRSIEKKRNDKWALYPGCPRFGDMLKTKTVKSGITHDIKSNRGMFKDDGRVKVGSRASEVTDPLVFEIFQQHIRNRFVKQYSKLRVTKVQRGEKGIYFISVAGEGQHWCLNKVPAGDHSSNTIYFEATKDGICVRCRCPKQTTENRAKGVCKHFKSSLKPLHSKEVETLFSYKK